MSYATDMVEAQDLPQAVGGHALFHAGIDLNSATAAEICARLNGVGSTLASAIVRDRELFGPFLTLRDLARVRGIGPTNFTLITGLAWRKDGVAGRQKVMEIINPTDDGDIDLPHVARRFAAVKGFQGCIISDSDGQIVACSWSDERNEALAALAPHFMKRLARYLPTIGADEVEAMTIFAGERALTMIPLAHLVMVVIQEPNSFSRRQLRIAQQVAETITQMLFR